MLLRIILSLLCVRAVRAGVIAGLATGGLAGAESTALQPKTDNVLVIMSQHRGDFWCESILTGLQTTLAAAPSQPRLFIEYLDVHRLDEKSLETEFCAVLRTKHREIGFRAIVVADDQALRFMVNYRDQTLPSVPVIFCAANRPGYDLTSLPADFTGTVELFDYATNIKLAQQLLPATRQIFVMTGDTSQGEATKKEITRLSALNPPGIIVPLNASQLGLDGLIDRVSRLPPDTVFIPRNFSLRDANGRSVVADELYVRLAAVSSVPMIGVTSQHLLRTGLTGGWLSSGLKHGAIAAGQLQRLLAGTPIRDIPIYDGPANDYVFDYAQLVRWGIPFSRLPAGSILYNKPESYYDKHRQVILVTASIVSLQFLTIALLVLNIRRRRRTARALARSERLYKTLVETAPDCVFITDHDRLIRFVSPRTLAQFGYRQPADLIGRPFDDLFAADSRPALLQALAALWQSAHSLHLEATGRRQDGTTFQAELAGGEIQHAGRVSRAAMFTLRDITEKKSLEEQLSRSQRLDSLGALAGGVAHDLNNILTPILLSISTLKEFHADPDLLATLRPMELSVKRGAGILRQLLMFSRGRAGDSAPIAPEQIVRETLEIISPGLPLSIRRHVTVSAPIPLLYADATQLHQVLLNLILNARDAMPTGGDLTVQLTTETVDNALARRHLGARSGLHVVFTVTDTGTGMSPQILQKIHEPFFTTKAHGQSTGLGLSVVLAILKNHGGFLRVASTPGQGSTFRVYLPAAEPAVL
jgi:PAS domain S-box-containing protein